MPSAEIRTAILKLVVGMFDASPNEAMYLNLAHACASGMSLLDLARSLTGDDIFRSANYFPDTLSERQFADKFTKSLLGLSPATDLDLLAETDYYRLARDWVEANLAATDRGTTVYRAIEALATATDTVFTNARTRLENRAAVADYYVSSGGAADSVEALHEVIAQVSASATSVTRAMATIDTIQTESPTGPETEAGRWTIMVYMAADNDLETYALGDLNEMEAARPAADVSIAVAVDRTPGYDSSNDNWTDTRLGLIDTDSNVSRVTSSLVSQGEWNMGSAASLTRFIDWAVTTSPADHYALVLWDHGAGIRGICYDDTSGDDRLTLNEIHRGVADSALGKVDLLGFDACSMALVEVARAVADVAGIMVASEDTEPAAGWNYTRWLNQLLAPGNTATALATAAIDTFGANYKTDDDVTLAAIDLSKTGMLAEALDKFIVATRVATAADWQAIHAAQRQASYFYDADSIDLIDFAHSIAGKTVSPALADAALALSVAVDTAVIAATDNETGANGLAVYWPDYRPYAFSSEYNANLVGLLGIAPWNEFLSNYWSNGLTA